MGSKPIPAVAFNFRGCTSVLLHQSCANKKKTQKSLASFKQIVLWFCAALFWPQVHEPRKSSGNISRAAYVHHNSWWCQVYKTSSNWIIPFASCYLNLSFGKKRPFKRKVNHCTTTCITACFGPDRSIRYA